MSLETPLHAGAYYPSRIPPESPTERSAARPRPGNRSALAERRLSACAADIDPADGGGWLRGRRAGAGCGEPTGPAHPAAGGGIERREPSAGGMRLQDVDWGDRVCCICAGEAKLVKRQEERERLQK